MLLPRESIGVKTEEVTSVLDDQEVDDNDDNPNDEEGNVVEEALADVDLVVDFSGGEHVDNLKPDEQVEDEGHVTGRITIGALD